MDRNTITGLLLIFVIVLGVSFYNSSQQKKALQEKAEREAIHQIVVMDSLSNMITIDEVAHGAESRTQETESNNNSKSGTQNPKSESIDNGHYFFTPEMLPAKDYVVETSVAIYHFSKLGGYLNFAYLKDIFAYAEKGSEKPPLILFDGENTKMNIELLLQNQTRVQTQFCYFASEQADTLVIDENCSSLSLKLFSINNGKVDNASYIEYLYTFKNDDYSFGFRINYVNMQNYLYPNSNIFTLQWDAALKNVERNYDYERNITSIYYMDNLDKVDNLSPTKYEKKDFSSQLKWVSFKQQFFTTVLIADSGYFSSGQLVTASKETAPILKNLTANLEFDVKNLYNGSFDMSMYLGPNQYKLLRTYDLNLERQVPIGWGFFLLHWINRGAVIPIFDWLSKYALSYGIIILILTILLKIVLMPIAYKTYLSSARMRVLKPEVDEISAKFPKSEDAMKKQQATMALYRSAGASPMAGCLPMLLQMPILIAMFRFFPSAYELRQQPFLWADDLSTYDSVWNFGINIPFYGDHVSMFCLLMTAATLIYTWMNNKMMTMGNSDQMKMMKVFMYFMPIMFLGIFNSFASGLTYYYLLVNLITFLQMWIFRMGVDEEKIRARMKANMSKPQKKSKWQARMEDMVKQQQAQQKRKK
jgi:YidC/Oxa1 family membrane protein insertase